KPHQVKRPPSKHPHHLPPPAEPPPAHRLNRDHQPELAQVPPHPQPYPGTGRGPRPSGSPCVRGWLGAVGCARLRRWPGRRRARVGDGHATTSSLRPVASAQSRGPAVSTATAACPARSSTLAAVVARSPCAPTP